MLDLARLNGNDPAVGLIQETIHSAPEVNLFPARTIRGTTFKTGFLTGLPTASFRSVNGGVTASKATFSDKLTQCFVLGGRVVVDVAAAQAYEDGPDAFWQIQAMSFAEAAIRKLGRQIFYGTDATSGDALGFPGLRAFTPHNTAVPGYTDKFTVNATGTTTGDCSSVYFIKLGAQHAQMLFGNGQVLSLSEMRIETETDSDGKKFPAMVADLSGWAGLSLQSVHTCRRINNVTTDSGKGMTDSLAYQALELFPAGVRPDLIVLSRRSGSQWQRSRTPVNLQGVGKERPDQPIIAPRVTNFDGIPVIESDSILNTDALNA